MSLSLHLRRIGDIVVIKCTGRIVEGEESAALRQQFDQLLPKEPYVLLDLRDVDFIDSGGLGLLVRFLSRARNAHGDVKVCAVPARIGEVLRITRLDRIFDRHASEATAVAAFYERPASGPASDRLGTDILCVESSGDVLAYVCGMLRQSGYGVMASDNLADAFVLLRASRPKLVIVGAGLHAARGTPTADMFNQLAASLPLIELPADLSGRDAGEAGERLLDQVRSVIGVREGARLPG